uniref:G protein-regulated inducer of neurite outgrowth C-terminal domain-containing protein n=1 Tax=Gasterosteus aculeatus aculeatus TaxID=481459 RepID=A0AAQ4P3P2_GASAC|nr:GRIN2-like protein [Gasterosteus aculeatus aculeatus]
MAWRPVSEQLPLVGAASLDATLSDRSLFDTSRSSSQTITPCRPAGGLGNTCSEPPEEPCAEPSATSSTTETNCSSLKAGGEPGDREQTKTFVNLFNAPPRASLPIHRSHSDTLPLVQQEVPPQAPVCRTCAPRFHHGGNQSIQNAEGYSMSACKQPMPLQQCNVITAVCRGVTGGEGGAQHAETRGGCVSSPRAVAKVQGRGEMGPYCKKLLCYGSNNQHVNSEDTFAAYCHPQPIPAPCQLLPHPAGAKTHSDSKYVVAPPSATDNLPLPRLISSVSETGLDAKHLLRCCSLNCSWSGLLPPVVPQSQKYFGAEECCISPVGHVSTITRDTGTMTALKELRDVGVQTGQMVTAHVFPQICLVEESKDETSCSRTLKKSGGALKSPVKEVKWDAEGMTWEVYGASVDPEELGVAIQKHLELQIKETASLAAKLSRQDTNTSQQVEHASCQRKRSGIISSIRTPGCCTRSSTAVD